MKVGRGNKIELDAAAQRRVRLRIGAGVPLADIARSFGTTDSGLRKAMARAGIELPDTGNGNSARRKRGTRT